MVGRNSRGLAIALSLNFLLVAQLLAGPHKLRQRPVNRHSVPCYCYGFDDPRPSTALVAVASVDQPAIVPGMTFQGRPVQRKVFALALPALTNDQLHLSRISLALYDNGQIVATGKLEHDGSPNRAIQGNNVTIRVRAFASTPQFKGELNNAPMLWQTERKIWATRNRPQMVSLVPLPGDRFTEHSAMRYNVPPESSFDELIRQHFNEITHLEIELEYRRDR